MRTQDARLRPVRTALAVAAIGTLAGCGGMGGLGDLGGILGGGTGPAGQPQQGEMYAEVQDVDPRRQELLVRTDDGRRGEVRYDRRTRVVYRNREYEPTALERGDVVRMRVQQVRGGELYTDYVQVEQSVQERRGGGGGGSILGGDDDWDDDYRDRGYGETLAGEVGWIDHDRGSFTVNTRSGPDVMVYLPRNASDRMIHEFRDLRENRWIEVTVRPISRTEAELVAFR